MYKFSEYFNSKYSKLKEKELRITSSQLSLLQILASGATIQEAALLSGKKYDNIKKRTNNLYKKFKVTNRADLIRKAINAGLISTKDVKVRFKKRFIKREILPEILQEQGLTEEELRYLYLVSQGKTQKEIIAIMGLCSVYMAQYLRKCICEKLNCKNITESVRAAFVLKIIQ